MIRCPMFCRLSEHPDENFLLYVTLIEVVSNHTRGSLGKQHQQFTFECIKVRKQLHVSGFRSIDVMKLL